MVQTNGRMLCFESGDDVVEAGDATGFGAGDAADALSSAIGVTGATFKSINASSSSSSEKGDAGCTSMPMGSSSAAF